MSWILHKLILHDQFPPFVSFLHCLIIYILNAKSILSKGKESSIWTILSQVTTNTEYALRPMPIYF